MKKYCKKTLSCGIAFLLLFCFLFVGCGDNTNGNKNSTISGNSSEPTNLADDTKNDIREDETEDITEVTSDNSNNSKPILFDKTIKMGWYEQDGDFSEYEEIEWIVLAEDGDKQLVISKYVLDIKPFHATDSENIAWEKSSLRIWLNGEFYANAFSDQEKNMIMTSKVKADGNPTYPTNQGNDTTDKIFLLSLNEASKYFDSNEQRIGEYTPYAYTQFLLLNGEESALFSWFGWWLRTMAQYEYFATGVYYDGTARHDGVEFTSEGMGVRPAMWINKNSTSSNETQNSSYYKGQIINFGKYEQDNDTANGKEDINWVVLEVKNNSAFVISKDILDYKAYHSSFEKITWEKCSLRKWLNSDFLNGAFNKTEQSKIIETLVVNEDYIDKSWDRNNADGGNDTKDKIFLLNYDDVKTYLEPLDRITCEATKYSNPENMYLPNWVLRTPKQEGYYVFYVLDNGSVSDRGVDSNNFGVRPAMWIKFD